MTITRTNPKVDAYLREAKQWPEEIGKLRTILLGCGLTEEWKWGKPCYTFQAGNVIVIQPFKKYCALLFFKGALLKDASGALVKTGENTEAGRQIRFTNVREIAKIAPVVKALAQQAMEVEKAGLKVVTRKVSELRIPEEFQSKLNSIPALKTAFESLTPGRQRSYIFHFSGAKQSATRASRVEKWLPQILQGKGLAD